jgi:hypothetical protein
MALETDAVLKYGDHWVPTAKICKIRVECYRISNTNIWTSSYKGTRYDRANMILLGVGAFDDYKLVWITKRQRHAFRLHKRTSKLKRFMQ